HITDAGDGSPPTEIARAFLMFLNNTAISMEVARVKGDENGCIVRRTGSTGKKPAQSIASPDVFRKDHDETPSLP
ncbi:MAG: hypothetical protein LIP18_06910, partial [Planctomycetes bacterium]|nr:hypothetical protein [Planctomycetota bacterium]